jgi:hypothetical protein
MFFSFFINVGVNAQDEKITVKSHNGITIEIKEKGSSDLLHKQNENFIQTSIRIMFLQEFLLISIY